jgi:hypothetical protein
VTRCDKGRVQVTTPCSNTKQVNTRHAQTPTIKQVNTRHAQTPTIKQVNTRHSPTPTKGHHPRRPAEAKLPLVQEYHSFSRVTPCTSCLRSSAAQRPREAVLSNGQEEQCCPTVKGSSAVQRPREAVLSNGQEEQCCPTVKGSSAVQRPREAVLSSAQGWQDAPTPTTSHGYDQPRLRPGPPRRTVTVQPTRGTWYLTVRLEKESDADADTCGGYCWRTRRKQQEHTKHA